MRAALALTTVLALARAVHAEPTTRALLDAVARQDVAAFDRLAPAPISLLGLWFDAPDCVQRFAGQGRLTMLAVADHPAFLKCLATLDLRVAPGGENAAAADLTYEPGVLIRLGVQGGLIRGFTVRGAVGDPSAASITPQALAAHRTAGSHDVVPDRASRDAIAASPDGVAFAELAVCVDAAGRVERASSVMRRSTNNPAYAKQVDAAVAAWQFKPFVVHGKPVRVCATDAFIYPPGHAPPDMPAPPPPPPPPPRPRSAALQHGSPT